MIILCDCPIQKRVSVFNRLKSEEEECGGARDDNSNLRNELSGLEDLGGNLDDAVFNEERRLARSKRFQEGKGNTRMFGKAVMQLGGHTGKYLLKNPYFRNQRRLFYLLCLWQKAWGSVPWSRFTRSTISTRWKIGHTSFQT